MFESLSDAEWTRVDAVLDEALDQAPEKRAAFLKRECAGEPKIRKAVKALLDADAEGPGFLDAEAVDFAGPAYRSTGGGEEGGDDSASEETGDIDGRRVGPYRLVEQAGQGGMSRVYRARRADGAFEQEVAVKLLPLGLDSEAARERFRVERQILADLQHPGIAQLYDGGVTEDDVPYLVLEYVEGEPITDYCDARQLSVDDRVHLLVQVGDVLQFAHRNLIVHRDVKPANVLVTEGTGTGPRRAQVKVLDFGIAKLLSRAALPDAGDVGVTTQTGQRPMTPAYAAPEQIRGDAIRVPTDVYQFGVLAYELLCGRRPFADCTHVFDVEQAVLHRDPERPSDAVAERDDQENGTTGEASSSEASGAGANGGNETSGSASRTPEARAAARGASVTALQSTLRGDLDTVLQKALRKEPNERYPSVEAMTDDLQRFREGKPVSARPATPAYRARKFLRRNRVWVGVAAAFVALAVGFSALYVTQVQEERNRAEATATFLKNVLSISDPETGQGGQVPARVLLKEGAAKLDTSFSEQPALKADLKEVIGGAFRGYGLYEEALDLHRDALALRRQQFGEQSLPVADTRNSIGEVHYYLDHLDSAEAQYETSLALRRSLLDDRHVDVAQSLNNLALVDAARSNYKQGADRMEKALAIFRANLPNDHWRVANALNNLAVLRGLQGDLAAAEARYREALEMHVRVKGDTHRDVAHTQANLGSILIRRGKLAAADSTLQQALQRAEAATASSAPVTGFVLLQMGDLRLAQGRPEEAERYLRRARDEFQGALPPEHRRQARVLVHLSEAFLAQDHPADALPHVRRALEIRTGTLDEGDWRIASAHSLLGAVLTADGRYAEADTHLRRSLDLLQDADHSRAETVFDTTCARVERLYDQWETARQQPACAK